jgi:ribosomal protein S18 acetylase RimI-like enzyme
MTRMSRTNAPPVATIPDVAAVVIESGGAGDLDRLEPLWVSVHHQHRRSMPELAPYVSDAGSWRERRALYERLFTAYEPILLLARDGDRLVGYGLAYAMPAADGWLADTWATGGDLVGEIESLAVLPEYRGRGVGSSLLRQLQDELRAQGAADLVLGVLPGNTDAVRLYERHGYRPTWLYLSRLEGRPPATG